MPREPAFSGYGSSSSGSDSDDTFSGDEHRRNSHSRPRAHAANAQSSSHHSQRESFREDSDTELRPRRRRNDSSRQMDGYSEPDNVDEPRSSRRRDSSEPHATERLVPQGDEYRHQDMVASNRETLRRTYPVIDVDDEELQKVFKASLAEQKASEQRIRQREEEIAAREVADEAAAIAESVRLAANPTAAQRREADADAELERVLRESAAEAEEKKARQKAELASLHARFGATSAQQPSSSPSRNPALSANSQRDRGRSAPRSPAEPSTGQREESNSTPREPAASSTERVISAGNNLLRRGVGLVRRPSARAIPAVQQPRRPAPARLAEISPDEPDPPSSPAAAPDPNPPIAAANHPRAQPDPPRAAPTPPGRQAGSPRRRPHAPAPQPNPPSRRNSERAPHVERLPIGRASSTSSRRYPEPARTRGELDPSIRQALNNSERWARLEQDQGGRNLREEEQMRMAIQNSLGDAPLPPDPIEGLIDPPPAYHKIGRDKKLDPLRYTTTNDKGNEPGFKRYITPEVLAIMKKFLLEQQGFDAKAKAAGNDLPPANNAVAKMQKRAPVVDNSSVAGSSSSAADPANSLENLLGTRLPPLRLPRDMLTNHPATSANANAFVSRVPGLASNARQRIPQSRPWDNAFSRLPRDK